MDMKHDCEDGSRKANQRVDLRRPSRRGSEFVGPAWNRGVRSGEVERKR